MKWSYTLILIPTIFSLIGTAWTFYRRQTVLNSVLLWLFVVPATAGYLLTKLFLDPQSSMYETVISQTDIDASILWLLGLLLNIAVLMLGIWGSACVLLVGKRLIKSPAGRTRSSFALVRKQGATLIIPLLLTEIMRICMTLLWSLLFIIPGIIYYIRTSLFSIIIAYEGKEYRGALFRSAEIVKGHTWTVLLYLLGITLTIGIPLFLMISLLQSMTGFEARLVYAAGVIGISVSAIAQIITILATILLFKHIKTFA